MKRTMTHTCVWQAVAVLSVLISAAFSQTIYAQNAGAIQSAAQTYMVVYRGAAVPADAGPFISKAGGALVYSYSQIGVAIVKSENPDLRANLLGIDGRVLGVSSTAPFRVAGYFASAGNIIKRTAAAASPAPGDDPLSGLQWDMRQIQAPEARAITGGSPSVIAGDLDSGIDWTHPDLSPNIDFANSVSCIGGVPNTDPAAWKDTFGHGTATAGIIAADKNGMGIVGVAPNVRLAAVKVVTEDGFIYPEAAVCGFMWAADHKFQVTNSSWSADPWLFNCRNDAVQRVIWEAERRAIRYAMQQGVVVVAVLNNFSDDLAHPTQDIFSPDNTTPETRTIHNDCAVVPAEIPGVIGVTANGNLKLKSSYSSYGVGVAQVIAPGGDPFLQITPDAPNGIVLTTFPSYHVTLEDIFGPFEKVTDGGATYAYLYGTSFAAPHVTGVVALLMSLGPKSPGAVASHIFNTSDSIPCPLDMSIYAPFPSVNDGAPQVCQGGLGYNSFNGHGQVNALRAVTTK